MKTLRTSGGSGWAEVQGARFLVNRLPAPLWEELLLALRMVERGALRRAVLEQKALGVADATESAFESRMADPVFAREARASLREIVRWGVAGHEGIADDKGAAVPFVQVDQEWEGKKFVTASPATVTLYEEDPEFFMDVYRAVAEANSLMPQEKKV